MKTYLLVVATSLTACAIGPRENANPSKLEDPSQMFEADDHNVSLVWKAGDGHPIDASPGCDYWATCPPSHYYEVSALLSLDHSVTPIYDSNESVTLSWRKEPGDTGVGTFSCGGHDARIVIGYDVHDYHLTSAGEEFGVGIEPGASCTIEVTRFDPQPGGIIEGSFDAVLVDYSDGSNDLTDVTANASGSFRVIRDE